MPSINDYRNKFPSLRELDDDSLISRVAEVQGVDREDVIAHMGYKPKSRNPFAVANDTVIEAANALAGGVKSVGDFVAPGNAVSQFIDENIIKAGEANQSNVVKGEKARYRSEMESADGIGDEIGSTLGYVGRNPLQSLAQAAGSFALPLGAVKAGGMLAGGARAANASAAGAARVANAGLAGGAVAGTALSGGDAAGTAYELVKRAGGSDDEATEAARKASVLPAAIGAAGGVIGAERLLAGAGGFKGGMLTRALKTAGIEGAQEAVEEGVTQYEGQRAAMPFDPSIDPMKGVAGAATMGATLGAATGAGVSLLTGKPEEAPKKKPGVADVLAAPSVDDAIGAATAAISGPDRAKQLDGETLIEKLPAMRASAGIPNRQRTANAAILSELDQLDPADRAEALSLMQVSERQDVSGNVRRYAQNRLDELLLPVRQIPAGQAAELEPDETINADVAMMKFRTPEQIAADGMPRVPTGEATDLEPGTIQPDDLLTSDGMPYGSKTAANVRAIREGLTPADVVEIPGAGWVIRRLKQVQDEPPRISSAQKLRGYDASGGTDLQRAMQRGDARSVVQPPRGPLDYQPDVSGTPRLAAGAPDGRAPDGVGGGGNLRPLPDADRGTDAAAQAPEQRGGEVAPAGSGSQPDAALTPGATVTLAGKSYTVKDAKPSAVILTRQKEDGGTESRVIKAGTDNWNAIQGGANEVANPTNSGGVAATAGAATSQPGSMFVVIGDQRYPVESFKQASELAGKAQDEAAKRNGGSAVFKGQPPIEDADGNVIAHIGVGDKIIRGQPVADGAPPRDKVLYDPVDAIRADIKAKNDARTVDAEPATKRLQAPAAERTEAPAPPAATQAEPAAAAARPADLEADGVNGAAPKSMMKPGFDSDAWQKERDDRIKASREAGNVHLDKLPAYVETMRGKQIRGVHDPKVKGRILTVDNNGNVYVEWLDAYSQEKEYAVPMKYGKKTVMQTSLGPRDLKDYALDTPTASKAETPVQAPSKSAPKSDAELDADSEPEEIAFRRGDFKEQNRLRKERQQRDVEAAGDLSNGGILRHEGGKRFVMVLPDVDGGGKWRVQRFDKDGFSGHEVYKDQQEAATAAIGEGFKTRDDGALDALQDKPEWHRGMYAADLIQRLSRKEISYEDVNRLMSEYDAKEAAAKDVANGKAAPAEAPKVYKTKAAAQVASKLSGNTKRVKKIAGGFILRDASEKELAAAEKAGKRLAARKMVDPATDPLLVAIAKLGGLAMNEKADTIGEGNKLTKGGHLFTTAGQPIDIMAGDLAELNYIPAYEVERDDGVTWLRDAIKAEYMGSRTHYSERNDSWLEDAQAAAQARYDTDPLSALELADLEDAGYTELSPDEQALTEQLMAEAEALGIDTETMRDEVMRATEGKTDSEYHAELQAVARQTIAQTRADAQGRDAAAARERDQDGEQAAGQEERQGLKKPAPVDEGERTRFTSNDGQVIEGMAVQVLDTSGGNYRIKIRTDEPAPQGGGNISRTVYSQDGTFEPADEPLLTAQTTEDLKAKAEREDAAVKAERAKKAADQERLRKEAEARDLKARADQTVDDFQLGQDAEQQMSGMGDMFAQPAPERDMLPPSTTAEAGDAAKRKRPHGTIEFSRPIVGADGNRLLSYSWQWKPFEYVDSRGEERTARVSDWDNSETSAETGREVVHQFTVDVDGKLQTVSAEGALRLLGFLDGARAAGFKSIASAAKTLARLKMQQSELQATQAAFEKDQAAVDAMPLPALPTEPVAVKTSSGRTMWEWRLGDTDGIVGGWDADKPTTLTDERRRVLVGKWHDERMAERGGWTNARMRGDDFKRQAFDLDKRIKKAEQRVDELVNDQPQADSEGLALDAIPKTLQISIEDGKDGTKLVNARKAYLAASQRVEKLRALAKCLKGG